MTFPIRTKPYHDAFEYCLDSAVEVMEITGAAHITIMLYGDPDIIEPLTKWHLPLEHRPGQNPRRDIALNVERYAGELLLQLPESRRRAIMGMSYPHIISNIVLTSRTLANWAHEDNRRGGCMEPFKKATRGRPGQKLIQFDGSTTPKLERRLNSPDFIRQYTHASGEARHYRNVMRQFFETFDTCRGVPDEAEQMQVTDDLEKLRASLRARRAITRNRSQEDWMKDKLKRLLGGKEPTKTLLKQLRTSQHKSIKRSVALASAILGAATVSAFARGEPVIIPGQQVNLQIARNSLLKHSGHGTVRCTFVDKDKKLLANLCVYHKDTPTLDQLAAFALTMQAGEEAALLESANFTLITKEGLKHPFIQKKKQKEPPININLNMRILTPRDDLTLERQMFDRYYDRTKLIWQDSLGVFTIGRRWNSLGRFFHSIDASSHAIGIWDENIERLNTEVDHVL